MGPLAVPRMQHFFRSFGAQPWRARIGSRSPCCSRAHGCGFHLQGAGTLPASMTRTYVETERPHSEFL